MKEYKSTVHRISLKKHVTNITKVKIATSQDAGIFARKFYFDDLTIYESFFVILLNRAMNTIGFVKISQGGTAGTVVDKKIIAKYAVDSLAESVILVHNHPSGTLKPSKSDIEVTKGIKEALQLFDINVIDHLILTDISCYSFSDEGII